MILTIIPACAQR